MNEILPSNIQGIVVRGITHQYSIHLLFHAPTAEKAQQLLSALLVSPFGILSAEQWIERPKTILQISLSAKFFELLKLLDPRKNPNKFPDDFINGPGRDEVTKKWLGDLGDSQSANWWDSQTTFSTKVHGCIHVYADSKDDLKALKQNLLDLFKELLIEELFPWKNNGRIEGNSLPNHRVHFGYNDGISQPSVAWPWSPSEGIDPSYFMLGLEKPTGLGFRSKPFDHPATNYGTYLVLRILEQNVPKFNRFLQEYGDLLKDAIAGSTEPGAEILAAKLVGRWKNGSPLVLDPINPSSKTQTSNNFDYSDDPAGFRCPFSAHIRVTNPRTNDDLNEVSKPLRPLLRRGIPYGPEIDPLDSITDDGIERGLIGMFLCSNIEKQFEIVSKWINDNSFRVYDKPDSSRLSYQDSLLGSSQNTSNSPKILIPVETNGQSIEVPLPEVLKTKGTLYLILPSITSLNYLANI